MLIFTGVDKALLDRAARLMEIRADAMYEAAGGNWGATKESRKAKNEYDVLMRDARDLRALGKRLIRESKASAHPPMTATEVLLRQEMVRREKAGSYSPVHVESVPQSSGEGAAS